MTTLVPLVIAGVSLVLLALGALIDDRRARMRRLAAGKIELPLLHSINDDRCIGCEACVDVCPTEVLELDAGHKAKVVRFGDCVQCEQCANACPTTALVMYRQGEAPKTLAAVDATIKLLRWETTAADGTAPPKEKAPPEELARKRDGLAIWVEVAFAPPLWVHCLVWLPVITAGAIAMLRPLKALMIALQYRHHLFER